MYMYILLFIYIYIYSFTCTYILLYIYIIYKLLYIYVYTPLHISICSFTYVYIYIYIYTSLHMYIFYIYIIYIFLGIFRAKAPKNGDAETEGQVCLVCADTSLFPDEAGLMQDVSAWGRAESRRRGSPWRCTHALCATRALAQRGGAVVMVGQGLEHVDPGAVSDSKELLKSTVCETTITYYRNHTACSNCELSYDCFCMIH